MISAYFFSLVCSVLISNDKHLISIFRCRKVPVLETLRAVFSFLFFFPKGKFTFSRQHCFDIITAEACDYIRRNAPMQTNMRILIVGLLLCALLAGCGHQHIWLDATCSAPKTCADCGATEGTATDHNWNDATCAAPVLPILHRCAPVQHLLWRRILCRSSELSK